MLNVPYYIQALYQTDSVQKNFRCVYTLGDGLYYTLTNKNIVRQSLHFTESLCSQQTFRFGLAEQSVIEFETVGIGNIRGARLACYIEIDTSGLTEEQLSNIEAYPGDGGLVREQYSDIGYGFYRIPLGTFIVADCPRDHKAQEHRKVTAYSPDPWGTMNPAAYAQLAVEAFTSAEVKYQPDAALLPISQMAYNDESVLTELGFTKSVYSARSTIAPGADGLRTATSQYSDWYDMYEMSLQIDSYIRIQIGGRNSSYNAIFGADCSTLRAAYAEWAADMQAIIGGFRLGYPSGAWVTVPGGATSSFSPKKSTDWLPVLAGGRWVTPDGYSRGGTGTWALSPYFYFEAQSTNGHQTNPMESMQVELDISSGFIALYAYGRTDTTANGYLCLPTAVTFSWTNQKTGETNSKSYQADASSVVVYKYDPPAGLPMYGNNLSYSSSYGDPITETFLGAYNARDLVGGYLEVVAKFARYKRNGRTAIFELSDGGSQTVSENTLISCDWDEAGLDEIGVVRFLTHRADKTIEIEGQQITIPGFRRLSDYFISNSPRLYSLESNSFLGAFDVHYDDMEALLTERFIPALQDTKLGTANVELRALPWVEPGDVLTVPVSAGQETVDILITRQEFSGIQLIMQSVEEIGTDTNGGQQI